MKTVLQVDITFEQILCMVKRLSRQQKEKVMKELKNDAVNSISTKSNISLQELFGAYESDETAEEIIDNIKS